MITMSEIKSSFNNEAQIYDDIILKLIPHYHEMIDALVSSIPFEKAASIKVLDLGCGTGTIAKTILEQFPNAKITLVDISEKMLELAEQKIGVESIQKKYCIDFYEMKFVEKYDVVVSSLALHHLITDEDKIGFYAKIFAALSLDGVFLNADVVLGSSNENQDNFMEKWISYMRKSCTVDDIYNNWLVRYQKEDRPAVLLDQIKWLLNLGFSDVDVIWKYYNFAVYGGVKRKEFVF
jgi:tRNA (cmo5U34)-methyltransferase